MADERIVTRRTVQPAHVLAVASLGVFLTFVDATIVNVAFPDIRRSFPDAGLAELSWVFNAYNIVFAAFLIAAGRFADLLGRKKLFELGIAAFTLASVLCAIAPSPEALIAARVFQAAAAAAVVPASLALVLEGYPPSRRAHAVAAWGATAALAAGLGPSLGGVLVDVSDWRLAFLVNLPIGVAAVVLSRRLLVESRAPGVRTLPDLTGAAMLALALGFLTLAITKGQDWGWTSLAVFGALAVAMLLAAEFAFRSGHHSSPIIDPALVRIRSFAVANGLTVVTAAAFFANLLCCVLFLTTVWRYSLLEAGLAITPAPFVAAAVARPWGRLADRLGYRPVLVGALVIYTAAVLLYVTRVGATPAFLAEWLPAQVVTGVAAGAALPLLQSAAVAAVPGGRFASASAVNAAARQVGAVIGIAVLVAIIGTPAPAEAPGAFDRAWIVIACSFALVAVGSLALGGLRAATDSPEEESAAEERRTSSRVAIPAPTANGVRPRTWTIGPDGSFLPSLPGATLSAAEFLRLVPCFSSLSEPVRLDLAERAAGVELHAGEWLFRRGDAGDSLFVLRHGRLEVVQDERVISTLAPGAVLGELALLEGRTRAACIRARRDSELLRITRSDYDAVLAESPELGLVLARAVIGHLEASAAGARAERPKTIAVVPLSEGASARQVAERLGRTLAACGPTASLDGGECAVQGSVAEYARLLDSCERTSEHVVLLGGTAAGNDAWTRFCLRQADRVLGVASRNGDPVWLAGCAQLRGCELVLCGTADHADAWRDRLDPEAIHLASGDDELDARVDAIARRLAGRAVGLVLSGGGARAFAHIGALQELTAAGVTIDRVAGASMGAFVGAMVALGMPPDEIDARCYDEWVRRSPLGDYTLPRRSLIRGDRVRSMITRNLGSGPIEQLDRRFSCVSADLLTGELVEHRTGALDAAVSASLCVPGLAAPIESDGRLLVDGGVIDNLPVESLARTGEGPVLAIDVTTQFRRGSGAPSLPETLARLALMRSANTGESAARHADLVIRPEHNGVGLLEFHQIDRMQEAGRRAALAALESAPDSLFQPVAEAVA